MEDTQVLRLGKNLVKNPVICPYFDAVKNKTLIIELSLLFVALVWALNFSIVKMSLPEIDPMSFNAIRFGLATLLMWGILLRKRQYVPIRKSDWPRLVILGLIGNLVYQMFFIWGIEYTFSANAAIMLGTIPVWVAVISHFFFEEKLTRLKAIGVSLTFSGVMLILLGSGKEMSIDSTTFIGDILTLASAVVFGYYTVKSKEFLGYYPPLQLTTISMTIGGGALILLGIPSFVQLDFGGISFKAYAGVFYSGILSVGLAYIIWNYGLRQVGAVRTSTYQNLVPVLGLILGYLILDEKLVLMQYVGSAIVIGGIVLTRKK